MIQPPLIARAAPIEIALAKSEPGEDAFGLRLDLPIVLVFQFLVRFAAGQLEHRLVAGRRGLLREEADRRALLERDLACIGRGFAEDQ